MRQLSAGFGWCLQTYGFEFLAAVNTALLQKIAYIRALYMTKLLKSCYSSLKCN